MRFQGPCSSPERWERLFTWSTNSGDEVRRWSSGWWSPTICSLSLSRFLTDSEISWPFSMWKYPASRHLVGRASLRDGLGLSPGYPPVFRHRAQWSVPHLAGERVGTEERNTWLRDARSNRRLLPLQPLFRWGGHILRRCASPTTWRNYSRRKMRGYLNLSKGSHRIPGIKTCHLLLF